MQSAIASRGDACIAAGAKEGRIRVGGKILSNLEEVNTQVEGDRVGAAGFLSVRMAGRRNRVSGGSKTPKPAFHSSSFQFPISPRRERLMVILKGKRNGACIIHSTGSLIFPLIIPDAKGEGNKKTM